MTEKEIQENNVLLAEFMGWKSGYRYGNGFWIPNKGIFEKPVGHTHTVNGEEYFIGEKSFAFYKDWNWLMAIVSKIESIVYNDELQFNVLQEQCFVEIIDRVSSESIVDVDGDTKLQATYEACVEFVKWYNEKED